MPIVANSSTGPAAIVSDHIDKSHRYANTAFTEATSFLTALSNYSGALSPIASQGYFNSVTVPPSPFVVPEAPTAPDITPVIVEIPAFTPAPVDTNFEGLGTIPTFTEQSPTVSLPSAPALLSVAAPDAAPTLVTSFDYPDAPSDTELAIPSPPTFESLSLPTAPDITLPTFSGQLPSLATVGAPPSQGFEWEELMYSDPLLSELSSDLLVRIQSGGTGLNPDVEQALWDRERNREDILSIKAIQQATIDMAGRGFSRPPGALFAAIDNIAQETQNKQVTLGREISIKQAELELDNLKMAIAASVDLEGKLLGYSDSMQSRAQEGEKLTVSLGISLYEAKVTQFSLELDVYKAASAAFESELKAELTALEIYNTELKGQSLVNDLNKGLVDQYVARLGAVTSIVDVYKTKMEAVNVRVGSEKLKVDNYKGVVDAYSAQVSAKRDEYSIYSEQIKAELAKVSVYSSQADAFTARVRGYALGVDTESKKVDARIAGARSHTDAYLAAVEGLVSQSKANQLQVASAVDIYRGNAAIYSSKIDAESSRVTADTRSFELQIREAIAKSDASLKNAEIAMQLADSNTKLQIGALEAGATVSSQLAASSLSAMSIGASISGSSSDQHIYQEK